MIASITVAIVRIPKLGDQVQSLKPNFIREMKEGMAVLRQNKGLFALLLVGTLYMFVYMPINALYPLITMEYFNGTPMHISITEIAYASGMLIGGLLLGLFGNYQKRINFYDGDKLNHFRITSSKWIFHICSLLCNNGAFGSVLQRCANSSFSGEN